MKICPVCASTLFDDMPTCFGCLYQFGSNPALEEQRATDGPAHPAKHEAQANRWASLITGEEVAIPLAPATDEGEGPNFELSAETDDSSCGSHCGGGEGRDGRAREMELPGWVVRVRAEGPGIAQTSLTIEIEPSRRQDGSQRRGEIENGG